MISDANSLYPRPAIKSKRGWAMKVTGEQVRALRESRGESQTAFAEMLNVRIGSKYSAQSVCRWETGIKEVPPRVAAIVANNAAPAPATVIALANQKGGVGKTTTAVNLGYALADKGNRVLIVDIDPQANATVHLGQNPMEAEQAGRTVFHALLHGIPVKDIVIKVFNEVELYIAPSDICLSEAEAALITETGGNAVLREVIEPVRVDYDYIIIDAPPHLGMLTANALTAADYVLIPSQTELLSSRGIPLLLRNIDKTRRRSNPRVQVLGILPTMYSGRNSQDQAALAELKDAYGGLTRVFEPIVRTTVFAQGVAEGMPALAMAPKASGIGAYLDLADAIAAIINADEMEEANG